MRVTVVSLPRPTGLILLFAVAVAACDHGSSTTQPQTDPKNYVIAVQGGDRQFGAAGAPLTDPLQVVVIDTRDHEPVSGVAVAWRITTTAGAGAVLTQTSSTTDASGIASTQLRLGQSLGDYVVQATFTGLVGNPATLTTTAALAPQIASFSPSAPKAGDTLTITGINFSPRAADDIILFSGIRAIVAAATATQLRIVVPLCVSGAQVTMSVALGALAGNSRTLQVNGAAVTTLQLSIGAVASFTDPAALACVRLPNTASAYLVVTQNATEVAGRTMPFQLSGITRVVGLTSAPTTTFAGGGITLDRTAFGSTAAAFEASLRVRELDFGGRSRQLSISSSSSVAAAPAIGDRRSFNVINKDSKFTKITAEIKAITAHAIIFEDITTPTGGFTADDYNRFGAVFDDPIYATDVAVFGQPSDVDANGKIIALFTPVVNQLSSISDNSFIAGFFYGCDLVDAKTCSGTNTGEVFYSLVPDANGQFGIKHTKDEVFRTVEPVLGHELMHMIQFNQRVLVGGAPTQEALWLAEGLAHAAEDTLGGVFMSRGDLDTAFTFRRQNYTRAFMYLRAPYESTLLSFVAPGTLQERGAAWLFIRYLMGRFGGDILGRISRGTASSTVNVTAETQKSWPILINDWTVAMYADDAPELASAAVESRYTYPNINLRSVLSDPRIAQGFGYPLRPVSYNFTDFAVTDTLPAATANHVIVQSNNGLQELGLSLGGIKGISFPPDAKPQIAIMRLR